MTNSLIWRVKDDKGAICHAESSDSEGRLVSESHWDPEINSG